MAQEVQDNPKHQERKEKKSAARMKDLERPYHLLAIDSYEDLGADMERQRLKHNRWRYARGWMTGTWFLLLFLFIIIRDLGGLFVGYSLLFFIPWTISGHIAKHYRGVTLEDYFDLVDPEVVPAKESEIYAKLSDRFHRLSQRTFRHFGGRPEVTDGERKMIRRWLKGTLDG